MKIAVVGAGRVGSTLGRRWCRAGHAITYVVRKPDDHGSLTDHATLLAAPGLPDAVDVVVLAVPGAAIEHVCRSLSPAADVIVVDATNPLGLSQRVLEPDPELSGGERVARWLPGTRVVKAFNTTGVANMVNSDYGTIEPVMPVAGDDPEATGVVVALARELGFDALAAGPLSAARDLEHLAALWIRLAYTLGNGPGLAFALLRREADG